MQRFLDTIARGRGGFTCTDDDLAGWLDDKEILALKRAGVLVDEESAGTIQCPACGTHMVTPVFSGTNDGKRNYYIKCDDPAIGTFDLIEDFRRYRVDLSKLAKVIASGLGIDVKVQEAIAGQLYQLGTKTTARGSVRCWLLLSDDISEHMGLFEESSKSSPLVLLCGHTPPILFIDSVAVIDTNDVISVHKGQLKIDSGGLDRAAGRLIGTNYYEGETLYVRGESIASFTKGTTLDVILKYITAQQRIDKTVTYRDIFQHYKSVSGSKAVFSDQWCHQALSDIRSACAEDKRHLVDISIQKGGKENQENSLFFKSKG